MSKFLKIEVLREQVAEIYVEVPDEFDRRKDRIPRADIQRLVKESKLDNFDWDGGFEPQYSTQTVNEVAEEEATVYEVVKWTPPAGYVFKPPLPPLPPPWPVDSIIPDPRCPAEAVTEFSVGSLQRMDSIAGR